MLSAEMDEHLDDDDQQAAGNHRNVTVQSRPLLTLTESAQSFFLAARLGLSGIGRHLDILDGR
jgi:hypothetical protein